MTKNALELVIVAAAAALACAGCSASAPETTVETKAQRTPSSSELSVRVGEVAGVAFAAPRDWLVRTRGRGFVDPALCFELASSRPRGAAERARTSVSQRGVEIRVVELLDGPPGPDTRPTRIALAAFSPPGAVEWSRGHLFSFRQRNRWIYLGVVIGADASAALRASAERSVDSIRVTGEGRC